MAVIRALPIFVIFLIVLPPNAFTLETDQFLVWGVELKDSADPLNEYLNGELQVLLDEINAKKKHDCDCEEIMPRLYKRIFKGLFVSRPLVTWINQSPDIDLYPPLEEPTKEYRVKSIFRARTFPFFLPLSRTVRVGDVYLGLDKLGHMFGHFGRHYNKIYRKSIKVGLSEEEAIEKAVMYGVRFEWTIVGYLTDSVFSHGDLEANFQGFRLIYDGCAGDAPILAKQQGKWVISHPIDLRNYVTPDFDESYNLSHYWGLRKKYVHTILQEEYSTRRTEPEVKARFALYDQYEPSFSKRYVDAYFQRRKIQPQGLLKQAVFAKNQ